VLPLSHPWKAFHHSFVIGEGGKKKERHEKSHPEEERVKREPYLNHTIKSERKKKGTT